MARIKSSSQSCGTKSIELQEAWTAPSTNLEVFRSCSQSIGGTFNSIVQFLCNARSNMACCAAQGRPRPTSWSLIHKTPFKFRPSPYSPTKLYLQCLIPSDSQPSMKTLLERAWTAKRRLSQAKKKLAALVVPPPERPANLLVRRGKRALTVRIPERPFPPPLGPAPE